MKLKKYLGLLMAAMLVFAVAAPVAALAADAGSITITKSSDDTSPVDKTFAAYKILDVSLASDTTPAYTVPSAMLPFYNKQFHGDASPSFYAGLSQAAIDADVISKIAALTTTSAIENFAQAALKWLQDNSVAATVTIGPSANLSDYANVSVPLGYYIIGETNHSGDSQVSAVMLDTTRASVSIALKANTPNIDKEIMVGSTPTKFTDGDIGDTVNYQITTKVPDATGFDSYTFAVSDKLSAGLTFQNDIVVKLDGATLTAGTDYTVDTTGTGYTFKINFLNFAKYKANDSANSAKIGAPIVITYSAKINENAVIGNAGNPNEAYLNYSNDPQNNENPTKTTPKQETFTYVAGIDITKIVAGTASDPVTLAGATFTLKGVDPTVTNTVVTFVQNDTLVVGTDTIYYKQTDGSYSTTGTGTKYERSVQTTSTTYTATATTGANGVLTFNGLNAGTYTLTETDAPDGYMLAAPATIVITWNDPATHPAAVWTYTMNGSAVTTTDGNGEMKINVEDTKGTELPSTGGIGTTIFYIGGLALIVAAGVLLILKRKGKAEAK
jgi:fimbrial isopeptide formation D2 family protein/LPXTG-motif cell wall-anchored protein